MKKSIYIFIVATLLITSVYKLHSYPVKAEVNKNKGQSISEQAKENKGQSMKDIVEEANEKNGKVTKGKNGNKKFIPNNKEKFIEDFHLEKPSVDAELLYIIIPDETENDQVLNISKTLDTNLSGFGVAVMSYRFGGGTVVRALNTSRGTGGVLATAQNTCYTRSGCQNLHVSINQTKSYTSSYSANVSVASSIVGAGVGYSIGRTKSISLSASETTSAKYGQRLTIQAYPRIEVTGFEVWRQTSWWTLKRSRVGSGSSWQAVSNYGVYAVWLR